MVAEDGDFPVKRLFKFKMGDPINSDSPFGHFRDGCGKFVNSRIVQGFMTIVIILMAINLGLLTSSSFDDSTISALNMLDFIILCLFTAEFSLQFIYLGLQVFRNPWLVFDVVLVIASWAALGSPVKVLRSFRIFRVFGTLSNSKGRICFA
jgi:voltage-gated sodium channel